MRTNIVLLTLCLLPVLGQAQTGKSPGAREMFFAARDEGVAAKVKAKPRPKAKQAAPIEADATPAPSQAPASIPNSQQQPRGDMVQASYSSTTSAVPLGLRYTLLKRVGDHSTEVSPSTVFHSGDSIQLGVEVTEPGYLYVVTRGSSGTWQVLFPSPKIEHGDNRVRGGSTYTLPEGHVFSFDEKPGTEKLFLIFSRQPEPQIDNLIYSLQDGKATPASTPEKTPPKSIPMLTASLRPIDDAMVNNLRTVYARDLVIENIDEKAPASKDKSVYVVNPKGGSASRLTADIPLKHE